MSEIFCDALQYFLDSIFIRFGSQLYRQIIGIPMGTNSTLVAGLFLFFYEVDFMLSLSDNNQTNVFEAFNSTSRYLDDLLLFVFRVCLSYCAVCSLLPCGHLLGNG